MAKGGDVFLPLAAWQTAAMSEKSVGIELTWALSEADLRAGRLRSVRLAVGAGEARLLAQSLMAQAAVAEQRERPN